MYCINVEETDSDIVLFNTLTGGIIELNKEVYHKLLGASFPSEDIDFFNELFDELFIVPEGTNEYQKLRYREKREQQNPIIEELSFVIAPTLGCNMRCTYCFEKGYYNGYVMDEETSQRTIRFINNTVIETPTIKTINITWFGGEPLLCTDLIANFIRQLKVIVSDKGIKVSSRLISNGALLDESAVALLKKEANLESVQITLDGTCKEYCKRKNTNEKTFHQVIDNICGIDNRLRVVIRYNADKQNLVDLYRLTDYLYKDRNLIGKIKIYFGHLKDYSLTNDKNIFSLAEYIAEKQKFKEYLLNNKYEDISTEVVLPKHTSVYCSLSCHKNFAIGPHGELYKCEHYFGREDKVIGDVSAGLYYNDEFFSHISGVQDSMCEKCSVYPICKSNCPEIHRLIKKDSNKCLRFQDVYDDAVRKAKKYIQSL